MPIAFLHRCRAGKRWSRCLLMRDPTSGWICNRGAGPFPHCLNRNFSNGGMKQGTGRFPFLFGETVAALPQTSHPSLPRWPREVELVTAGRTPSADFSVRLAVRQLSAVNRMGRGESRILYIVGILAHLSQYMCAARCLIRRSIPLADGSRFMLAQTLLA